MNSPSKPVSLDRRSIPYPGPFSLTNPMSHSPSPSTLDSIRFASVVLAVVISLLVQPARLAAQGSDDDLYITDGDIYPPDIADSILYVGGRFEYGGPATGHGAVLRSD